MTEWIDFDFYDDGVRKKPTRRLCIEKGEKAVRITSLFLVYLSDDSEMVMGSNSMVLPRDVAEKLAKVLKKEGEKNNGKRE